MSHSHLFFNTEIGVKKPESIRNKEQSCPFCARGELTDLIEVEDSIILLKNKFPVLENAYQTVLIETDDCHGEISTYSKDHLIKLMKFGVRNWMEMEKSEEYESVIFFKNHGPLSGGSIAHPHMQIVGLNEIDYRKKISLQDFEGLTIQEGNGVTFSLSTKPRVGFSEFNVHMKSMDGIEQFAEYIQTAAHYILNHFPYRCSSYNLFFYELNKEIYAKIVPRFVTTPIFVGYSIPQVPNNLVWMTEDIQTRYYNNSIIMEESV